jgi:hypothetical protein
MFVLSADPAYATLTVTPVNKATDRAIVREIFRREFYGDNCPSYPDDGLWEIYDRMETNGVFGAYLVCRGEQVLFLLEIHPPIQMDLTAEYFKDPNAIGIYCFLYCRDEAICLPAFQACIASLLNYSGIRRILTSLHQPAKSDPRARMLEKAGFSLVSSPPNKPSVYRCSQVGSDAKNLLSTNILFATRAAFTR